MENKRGISGIIVSLILIAFALAMVGIVWYVINNVMTTATDEINESQSELFMTCSQANFDEMQNETVGCSGTIKYLGGEKCCDGTLT